MCGFCNLIQDHQGRANESAHDQDDPEASRGLEGFEVEEQGSDEDEQRLPLWVWAGRKRVRVVR